MTVLIETNLLTVSNIKMDNIMYNLMHCYISSSYTTLDFELRISVNYISTTSVKGKDSFYVDSNSNNIYRLIITFVAQLIGGISIPMLYLYN